MLGSDDVETNFTFLLYFLEMCNTHVDPDGFIVYRGDRTVDSGKELGTGGVCLFVNNRRCNNVTVKDNKCSYT